VYSSHSTISFCTGRLTVTVGGATAAAAPEPGAATPCSFHQAPAAKTSKAASAIHRNGRRPARVAAAGGVSGGSFIDGLPCRFAKPFILT
jgi:hypothetical protein